MATKYEYSINVYGDNPSQARKHFRNKGRTSYRHRVIQGARITRVTGSKGVYTVHFIKKEPQRKRQSPYTFRMPVVRF